MDISLEPGTYVVAVSGGVDSMVLLHLLAQKYQPSAISHQPSVKKTDDRPQKIDTGVRLVVAHYDHGIRPNADIDRQLVQAAARRYGFAFVHDKGFLGPGASEAAAREARYAFLHQVRNAAGARAIITAHHQDDLLETAIINMVRGTGRRGVASLRSSETLVRPLLNTPKQLIITYAQDHGITWREDVTNRDVRYLRNYIRHKVLPLMDKKTRKKFISIIKNLAELNIWIDAALINHLHLHPARDRLERHWFIMLPHAVAREVMAAWLRQAGIRQYDKKTLERLVVAGKTMRPGGRADINLDYVVKVQKRYLVLTRRKPVVKQA